MIRVLLVDDHQRFRSALRSRLETSANVSVVGEAGDARQALSKVAELAQGPQGPPDVVVMDLRLRGGVDGIEATRRLLAAHPDLRVLALSTHDDPAMVRGWAAIGGCGYMLKGDPLPALLNALHEAAAGRAVYSASLSTRGAPP